MRAVSVLAEGAVAVPAQKAVSVLWVTAPLEVSVGVAVAPPAVLPAVSVDVVDREKLPSGFPAAGASSAVRRQQFFSVFSRPLAVLVEYRLSVLGVVPSVLLANSEPVSFARSSVSCSPAFFADESAAETCYVYSADFPPRCSSQGEDQPNLNRRSRRSVSWPNSARSARQRIFMTGSAA